MKNLKRVFVAVCLATVCLTVATAKQQTVKKVDLTEIGVDSATQSRLSDSTVVELTRMAIEHKEYVLKAEMSHEEQMMMIRKSSKGPVDNAEGVLFIIGMFSVIPIICVLAYKIIMSRIRRRREEEKNAMLLNLVSNGQTLTPELVESITHDKEQEKKADELTMHTSLRKLFLGIGLIVFAIVFHYTIDAQEPISFIVALFGIFYAAQGLAGYLTLTREEKDAQQSENE